MSGSESLTIVDATGWDDTWTCDQWQVHGVWTSKEYAMHGELYRWRGRQLRGSYVAGGAWSARSRRCCGTLNFTWQHICRRCGFPQPKPEPSPSLYCAGLLATRDDPPAQWPWWRRAPRPWKAPR